MSMPSIGDNVSKLSRRVRGWSGQLDRLRYPPWRHRFLIGLIVFPIVLGGVLALAVGPLAGLAGFSPALSVAAFFRHDLRPGPRLSTAIVTGSGYSAEAVFPPPELQRLDHEAIVTGEQTTATETAPEIAPEPEPSAGPFGIPTFEIPTVQSMLGPTRKDVVVFMAEVRDYGLALNGWLDRYEQVRAESGRQFRLVFRVENDGEAPAQNVRLRVRFPEGFRHLTKSLPVKQAPDRPRFRNRWDIAPVVPLQSSALREIGRRLTADPPVGPVPIVSEEQGQLVLTYEIGHLNHGPDHLRTDPVTLLAPETGDFDLAWEALSANPGPAAGGILKLRINPSVEVEPKITSMSEVLNDQQAHRIEQVEEEA
jgi:hypothetical protein